MRLKPGIPHHFDLSPVLKLGQDYQLVGRFGGFERLFGAPAVLKLLTRAFAISSGD